MQKDGQTLTMSPTVSPARKRCTAEVATELWEIRVYFCVFLCVGPTAYVTADEQNDRGAECQMILSSMLHLYITEFLTNQLKIC